MCCDKRCWSLKIIMIFVLAQIMRGIKLLNEMKDILFNKNYNNFR